MGRIFARLGLVPGLALSWIGSSHAAVDSYRFLHVTIETPWSIFVFLLFAVLAPFILMAVLVWRYAERRAGAEEHPADRHEGTQ